MVNPTRRSHYSDYSLHFTFPWRERPSRLGWRVAFHYFLLFSSTFFLKKVHCPSFWNAVRVNFPWYRSTGSAGSFNRAGERGQSKILMEIFQRNWSGCSLNIDWSQIIYLRLIIPTWKPFFLSSIIVLRPKFLGLSFCISSNSMFLSINRNKKVGVGEIWIKNSGTVG